MRPPSQNSWPQMKQYSLAILALLVGSGAIAMLALSSRTPDTASKAEASTPAETKSHHSDMTARLEEARSQNPLVSFVRETTSPSIDLGYRNSDAQTLDSPKHESTPASNAPTSSRARKQTTGRGSQTLLVAASEQDGIEIIVPFGARLPTALVQTNEGVRPGAALNSAQQELADDLATEFAEEIAQNDAKHPVPSETTKPNADALNFWKNAADRADDRFRSLFGFEAYNRESARQHQLLNQPTN